MHKMFPRLESLTKSDHFDEFLKKGFIMEINEKFELFNKK
jgi:hypothetical protein